MITSGLKQNLEFESFKKNHAASVAILTTKQKQTNKQTNKKSSADLFFFVAVQNRFASLKVDMNARSMQDLMSLACSFCMLVSLRTCMTLPSQATSPRPPSTSAASSRRKIQVTGTSVTPAAGKCERHPCHPFLSYTRI